MMNSFFFCFLALVLESFEDGSDLMGLMVIIKINGIGTPVENFFFISFIKMSG